MTPRMLPVSYWAKAIREGRINRSAIARNIHPEPGIHAFRSGYLSHRSVSRIHIASQCSFLNFGYVVSWLQSLMTHSETLRLGI